MMFPNFLWGTIGLKQKSTHTFWYLKLDFQASCNININELVTVFQSASEFHGRFPRLCVINAPVEAFGSFRTRNIGQAFVSKHFKFAQLKFRLVLCIWPEYAWKSVQACNLCSYGIFGGLFWESCWFMIMFCTIQLASCSIKIGNWRKVKIGG